MELRTKEDDSCCVVIMGKLVKGWDLEARNGKNPNVTSVIAFWSKYLLLSSYMNPLLCCIVWNNKGNLEHTQ